MFVRAIGGPYFAVTSLLRCTLAKSERRFALPLVGRRNSADDIVTDLET